MYCHIFWKIGDYLLENKYVGVWYTWPPGRKKNCNARGVFATATYKRGPYLTSGSLLRGSDRSPHKEVGATLLGSPRPTYHNPRAAGSKQHSWSSWLACHFLLHHNRGTEWPADPNSTFVNLIVLFCTICLGVRPNLKKDDQPCVLDPHPSMCRYMDCSGPGRESFKKTQENNHEPFLIQENSLKIVPIL